MLITPVLLDLKFLEDLAFLNETGNVVKSILIGGHGGLQFADDSVVGAQHIF